MIFALSKNNAIANPRSSGGSYNPEHSSRDNPVNIRYYIGNGIATSSRLSGIPRDDNIAKFVIN